MNVCVSVAAEIASVQVACCDRDVARALTGEIPPLISQYTNRFMRWFRVALALSFIVLMAWFIYTFFVQKSFFDWLGDRIDNLTDDTNASALAIDPLEAVLVLSH